VPSNSVRVGTLDDPIWGQPFDSATLPQRRRPRRRRSGLVIAGALLVLVLLGVGLTLWLSQPSQQGGDPGGRILTAIRPASAAVPTGSADIVTQSYDSVWSAGCPDNPGGHAGWSEVRVSTRFTTSLPKEQVVSAVNSVLVRDGWSQHDESFGPGQGMVAHWTKRLATGTPAEAAVYPIPNGSTNWLLTATATPPGFALPGC
jgi:hypothetical protein